MIYFILVALLVAVNAESTPGLLEAFNAFRERYGIKYSNDQELAYRLNVFADNLKKVNHMNSQHLLANGQAVFGISKFSDLTTEEFQAQYLNYRPINRTALGIEEVTFEVDDAPESVDWRDEGIITPVKDQGRCGSCWAFGATEAIESYNKQQGNELLELAPQQITSCDRTSYGCQGGWAEHAFNYVKSFGGIMLEKDYPYTSGASGITGSCNADASKIAAKISGYTPVATGEKNLEAALTKGAPTVCVAATYFQTYTGGILNVCDNNVDHCVQAVGYTADYWIVRNSWNTDWGEEGYIRIARGKDLCKIADDVTFPNF